MKVKWCNDDAHQDFFHGYLTYCRYLALFLIATIHHTTLAADEYYFPSLLNTPIEENTLTIYGAADYQAIYPVIRSFQQRMPNISVFYKEFSTRELDDTVRSSNDWPDLLLSPAMDLQIKLVNDGLTYAFSSDQTKQLPEWANWRDEVFAFTYEPVAIAVNKAILDDDPTPKNRTDLLNLIRKKSTSFYNKIGLLDIETVGLGYLTWAHDSQQSRTYGRLLEVFGAHNAQLYANSTSMLGALANQDIYIAYNVLGSYASDWATRFPEIEVIFPSDYTSVILRSALVPKYSKHIELARQFIDFILSDEGQKIIENDSSLIPIKPDASSNSPINKLRLSTQSPLIPITFGFPIILLTDQAKRNILLKEWENAMMFNK
ncbi:ABC transporter substrate-binding protein [Marinomonas sp. ef1]|uniref:ABC transporter substrate-binding protein n=1 Tax=Marinomonas sp. ef1 TaxID=2005043 RepID=UPI000C291929|nr:ABC transporter substrate-binding protein [Marinomonas sp. ef1]